MDNLKISSLPRRTSSARPLSLTRSDGRTSSTLRKSPASTSCPTAKLDSKSPMMSNKNTGQLKPDFLKHLANELPSSLKITEASSRVLLTKLLPDCFNDRHTVKNSTAQKCNGEPFRLRFTEKTLSVTVKKIPECKLPEEWTNCSKQSMSQTSKDTIQRLTNGGIAKVSLKNIRRHSLDSTELPTPFKVSSDKAEPKSILKNVPIRRQNSIASGEIYRCSKMEKHSVSPTSNLNSSDNESSPNVFSSIKDKVEMPPVTEFEPAVSDKDILSKCHYRLATGPMTSCETGPKKVTFKNDVAFMQD